MGGDNNNKQLATRLNESVSCICEKKKRRRRIKGKWKKALAHCLTKWPMQINTKRTATHLPAALHWDWTASADYQIVTAPVVAVYHLLLNWIELKRTLNTRSPSPSPSSSSWPCCNKRETADVLAVYWRQQTTDVRVRVVVDIFQFRNVCL